MSNWRDSLEQRQALQQKQYDREIAHKRRVEEREQRRAARETAVDSQSWQDWIDQRIKQAIAAEHELMIGVMTELVNHEREEVARACKDVQTEMLGRMDERLGTLSRMIDLLADARKAVNDKDKAFRGFACERDSGDTEVPNFLPPQPGRRDN
jgi:hypothetical protein